MEFEGGRMREIIDLVNDAVEAVHLGWKPDG
jgi:hypothetical protein